MNIYKIIPKLHKYIKINQNYLSHFKKIAKKRKLHTIAKWYFWLTELNQTFAITSQGNTYLKFLFRNSVHTHTFIEIYL